MWKNSLVNHGKNKKMCSISFDVFSKCGDCMQWLKQKGSGGAESRTSWHLCVSAHPQKLLQTESVANAVEFIIRTVEELLVQREITRNMAQAGGAEEEDGKVQSAGSAALQLTAGMLILVMYYSWRKSSTAGWSSRQRAGEFEVPRDVKVAKQEQRRGGWKVQSWTNTSRYEWVWNVDPTKALVLDPALRSSQIHSHHELLWCLSSDPTSESLLLLVLLICCTAKTHLKKK